jgi:hypothetical protein
MCFCGIDTMSTFQVITYPKSRKVRKCCECDRVIAVGEKYQKFTGKFDYDFDTYTTCSDCTEWAKAFLEAERQLCGPDACGAYEFCSLWFYIRELIKEHFYDPSNKEN